MQVYPRRLIQEARRAQSRLEMLAISQACGTGTAIGKWVEGGLTNPWLALAVAGGAGTVSVTWALRWRQIQRATWLSTTSKWWERLDEMPRMEPCPALVDKAEKLIDSARGALRVPSTKEER